MLEKERLRCIKVSNLFLCSRFNKRAINPRTIHQEESREKEKKRLKMDAGASSTPLQARYRECDLLGDTMVSPVLPLGQLPDSNGEANLISSLDGGVNGSLEQDGVDCVSGLRKKTNISDNLDGTSLTPPPKLSDSTEERKLFGGTLDISKALASNDIVDPALENNELRQVFENSLYKRFSRVQENEDNQVVNEQGQDTAAVGVLEGVDTSDWSQGSDFSMDKIEKEIAPTETPDVSIFINKRELSVSPNTPVGPCNKELKNGEVQSVGGSPVLRTLAARDDANISIMPNTRGRCHTLSNTGSILNTPNLMGPRSSSVGGKTRKKVGAKRRLIPGQALLPTMFSGLFKPSTGAGYAKNEEDSNNMVVGSDVIN